MRAIGVLPPSQQVFTAIAANHDSPILFVVAVAYFQKNKMFNWYLLSATITKILLHYNSPSLKLRKVDIADAVVALAAETESVKQPVPYPLIDRPSRYVVSLGDLLYGVNFHFTSLAFSLFGDILYFTLR